MWAGEEPFPPLWLRGRTVLSTNNLFTSFPSFFSLSLLLIISKWVMGSRITDPVPFLSLVCGAAGREQSWEVGEVGPFFTVTSLQ